MRKRTKEEIIAGILEAVQEPIAKTRVMYKIGLSYSQLKSYHLFLRDRKMIAEQEREWLLTDKGRRYLVAYISARRILDEV